MMQAMRTGMILPGGSATQQLELALVAEAAGWDGVFVWEAAYGIDAWGLLSAIAVRTERVRLGTLLTPLPWRRPWKVASQVATLDQLSGGRAILTVGLGAPESPDLPTTGERTDLRGRAASMDDGIDLIRDLWAERPRHEGPIHRYAFEGDTSLLEVGRPVQDRVPIWVVGLWPRERSMRRVLRCDGIVPQYDVGDREATPDDLRAMRAWLTEHGAHPDLDVIAEGETPADDLAAVRDRVTPWAEAGCTWWLETRWEMPHQGPERYAVVLERLEAGPPQVR
jgi:alkanesulfonate monooxygenase SsuD/methylene tetrahydromethanopterin reductase-like flavin-dependent oxidoreductase (luciferase family)